MAKKFYKCAKCGNIISKYVASGVPVVEVNGNKVIVKVGEVAHPMTEAHLISWIYLETNFGGHERVLSHTDEPKAEFVLADGEKALRAYEYCNLHGLWSAEVK